VDVVIFDSCWKLSNPGELAAYDGGQRPEPNDQKVAFVAAFVVVGAGAAIDRGAALHERVGIADLCGKQGAFRPILLNYFGLTPPDSCDNLGPQVADFQATKNRNFSTFRMV